MVGKKIRKGQIEKNKIMLIGSSLLVIFCSMIGGQFLFSYKNQSI